jgi:hypothetical protein
VEPFAGSLAVLLGRPSEPRTEPQTETINDADGFVVNFWRAVRADAEAVAGWCDWPVSELDLTARHLWLIERREAMTRRLEADPDYCDPKIAGWWVWGISAWIGSGWCSGSGPWVRTEVGVTKNGAGTGVNRQLPYLSCAGMGVHRIGSVADELRALSARLRRCRITSGDWSRVVTTAPLRAGGGTCGVFLDPPYPEGFDPDGTYGTGCDADKIWRDVCDWARMAGEDRKLRIVVAGYEGTWDPPAGWTARQWNPRHGYAKDTTNNRRERLWCSPGCVPVAAPSLFCIVAP